MSLKRALRVLSVIILTCILFCFSAATSACGNGGDEPPPASVVTEPGDDDKNGDKKDPEPSGPEEELPGGDTDDPEPEPSEPDNPEEPDPTDPEEPGEPDPSEPEEPEPSDPDPENPAEPDEPSYPDEPVDPNPDEPDPSDPDTDDPDVPDEPDPPEPEEPERFTLTLVIGEASIPFDDIAPGSERNLPSELPVPSGYEIDGWLSDGERINFPVTVDGDITAVAQLSPIEYEIKYELAGGTNDESNPDSYTVETAVTLLQAEHTCFDFAGWVIAGTDEPISGTEGYTENLTLRAEWTNESHTYDETHHCMRCGAPAETAEHAYGEWKTVREATCTECGSRKRECEICGHKDSETLQKLEHDWGEWTSNDNGTHKHVCGDCSHDESEHCAYTATVVDPTCEADGYTLHECKVCGYSYKDVYIDAKGHKYDEAHICTVCGVPAETAEHVYGEWKTVYEATCTEDGSRRRECEICGHKDIETLQKLGHDWGEWKFDGKNTHTRTCVRDTLHTESESCKYTATVTDPTCEDKGYTSFECEVCGYSYKDNYIDAKGHKYDEEHICTVCGTPSDTSGHVYSDGVCTICGKSEAPAAWDGSVSEMLEGEGSEQSPYLITSGADLAYLAAQVNGGEKYAGVYFRLEADIDLGGRNWTPIGCGVYDFGGADNIIEELTRAFSGIFDGRGRTVSNFTVTDSQPTEIRNNDNTYYSLGLFGALDGATVKNLRITGAVINADKSAEQSVCYAGILAGVIAGQSSVSCCDVSGEVSVSATTVYAGLLAGDGNSELAVSDDSSARSRNEITDCMAAGSVRADASENAYTGGLLGGSSYTDITRCIAAAALEVSAARGGYACGFVGYCEYRTEFSYCFSNSSVYASEPKTETDGFTAQAKERGSNYYSSSPSNTADETDAIPASLTEELLSSGAWTAGSDLPRLALFADEHAQNP